MGHVASPGSSAPRFVSSAATMHRAWYLCPHGVVTAGSDGDAVEAVDGGGVSISPRHIAQHPSSARGVASRASSSRRVPTPGASRGGPAPERSARRRRPRRRLFGSSPAMHAGAQRSGRGGARSGWSSSYRRRHRRPFAATALARSMTRPSRVTTAKRAHARRLQVRSSYRRRDDPYCSTATGTTTATSSSTFGTRRHGRHGRRRRRSWVGPRRRLWTR